MSGHLCRYERQLRNVNSASQDNMDVSGSLVGVQVSFSIWQGDIGTHTYIKQLSGIVNISSSELHVAFELSKACYAPFCDEAEA